MFWLVAVLWTTMWYFSVRGFLLIDPEATVSRGDVLLILAGFLIAPVFIIITLVDGNSSARELFFLGKPVEKAPKKYNFIKPLFGIKGE